MYIYSLLSYNSFCRIYDLSRPANTTHTTRLYSHQSRRKTKKLFSSTNNHIFYQAVGITIILISFVNFGQLTSGSVIQAKVRSIGQANGKASHAKVEEKVDWPLSFGDDQGPLKAQVKVPLADSGSAASSSLFSPSKGDASHATNNKPFPDVGLIDMAKLLARRRETPQAKIRNTSELHVDKHNEDSKEDGYLNNIPSTVYLQKVVVLQKPFHFHLPIFSGKENNHQSTTEKSSKKKKDEEDDRKRKRSQSNKSLKSLVRGPNNSGIKREILSQYQEGKALEANNSKGSSPPAKSVANPNPKEVDLDHLLQEHPKLIPSVSRKRDSGKLEHHDSLEDDHHVIGIPLDDDDDDMEQGGSQVLVSKRNIKTVKFSQEAVEAVLGHQDDLVKYRAKIIKHAKELGVTPEEAFHTLVFGVPTNQNLAKESNPNEIYQRRLKFHQLFLDDSTETEKYHSEVVDKNSPSNHVNPPFNAYMKILKRSKRGLKSWLKKIFKRQPKTTEKPYFRERERVDCNRKSNRNHQDCITAIKEELDEKGDSQADLLLPKALRRSSYLKRRTELKNAAKEEEEIEEEEEKSEEKEPTTREEDSEELMKYKKRYPDDDDNEDRRKRKRNLKRQTKSKSRQKRSAGSKIQIISKDEISVVLEMIFNLIEYQCTEISKKGEIMEGLLTITQNTVRSSSLPDYIPKRRSVVDRLFDQMLDCSSNTENLSKWSHYQMKRKSQKKAGASANTGILRNNGLQILKRRKRVKRDDTTSKAVELISINESTTLSYNVVDDDEDDISSTTENMNMNVSSDYHIVDNESINSVMKLYLTIFKIIPETCFKVDSKLINDTALVLLEEMIKLERNKEYATEIDDFVGHFDVGMADKLLTECYQNEL